MSGDVSPAVIQEIPGSEVSLGGGLRVRRTLPSLQRRTVGPFVFLDHFGPVAFPSGGGMDVRPHPHIGLATVTYLFEGRILHRDSLGSVSPIEPGAINWMTAGAGIVHSERTPVEDRPAGPRLHGLQMWVGLPTAHEEIEPSFVHTEAGRFPETTIGGARVRVLVGDAYGQRAPVATLSPVLLVELRLPAGAELIAPFAPERALLVIDGALTADDRPVTTGPLALLASDRDVVLKALVDTHAVVLGGAPLDGVRHVDWNFVSSTKDRLTAARSAWAEGRFPPVPGETEFIPLPPPRY